MTLLAGLGFFAAIIGSVALHELGHLIPAKLFGIKVTQYCVGFGKTLWSRTIRGTEYALKLLPLGGYVRIIGMYPPGRPGRLGWLNTIADQAREVQACDIEPGDEGSLMYEQATWKKIVVLFGGPAMNLVLAFVMFLSLNMSIGTLRPGLEVAHVQTCVAQTSTKACGPQDEAAPAYAMGMRVGDTIKSLNGVPVDSWDDFAKRIRELPGARVVIVVIRDGSQVTLKPANTISHQVRDQQHPGAGAEAGFIGVSPVQRRVTSGPIQTIIDMTAMTRASIDAIIAFPISVYNVSLDLIQGRPRDQNGPISIIGASKVAGDVASNDSISPAQRIGSWMMLLGSVNLFLALFNLVPLVPLDGGHIAAALYEWGKRLLARLRGAPDPGYADTAKMLPVAYAVGALVLIMGVILFIADVVSPLKVF